MIESTASSCTRVEYLRNEDESQREETAEDECGCDKSETGIGL